MDRKSVPVDNDKISRRALVVGLVGGVASGKSLVAEILGSFGAAVIDADKIARPLLDDPKIREKIITALGSSVLNELGDLVRSRIADLVFGDDEASQSRRELLNQIMFPIIRKTVEDQLAMFMSLPATRVIVIDAPLLLEAGWHSLCDRILFIDSSDEQRFDQAIKRGWSHEAILRREQSQWSLDRKRQAASETISNNGTLEELRQRMNEWYNRACKELVK